MKDAAQAIYASLYDAICDLPVIDTHEHLSYGDDLASDVLGEYLIHYLSTDLVSAGLPLDDLAKARDPEIDIMERWKLVEPFWDVCRHTGYARSLDIAAQGLYGVDGVHRHTLTQLNERFLQAKGSGRFRRVLKDACHIETSLTDVWTFEYELDPALFTGVWQPMNFILPGEPEGHTFLRDIGHRHGINIRGLDDWLAALEAEMDAKLAHYGARVLKTSIAYQRTLRFEQVDYPAARSQFSRALADWQAAPEPKPLPIFPPELQDFMMHRVLQLANARHLTFQFHTGLLESNGNTLSNSDPSLLSNLFLEYPDVNFDLFHIGYPYQGVSCALAKMFPNVTLDMCWAHIISPAASVLALSDFLDAVPYNKISAFGGDYLFVDGVYGHLELSRRNVARTLAGKVRQGVFDEGRALEIARALYYDNPKRIFQL